MQPLLGIHQRLARARQKRRDVKDERTQWLQWFLLVGLRPREAWSHPDPAGLIPLWPPADTFWADPFAWSMERRRFIFLEEYPFHTQRGRISVLELGADLKPLGPTLPVLDEDRHLSYPFLFKFEDELYMVPEAAASCRVDLYRCQSFPEHWTRVGTLIEGLQVADATLFEHEGRWWLFCSGRQGRAKLNNSLIAFHADSPLSHRWIPHARNPLVRDYGGGRPGGRVFVDEGGRLLRPAQNSVPSYGHGLVLNQVEALTPEEYRERRVWQATGAATGGWRALHHLDWHQGLLVMDAQRLIPRPTREL